MIPSLSHPNTWAAPAASKHSAAGRTRGAKTIDDDPDLFELFSCDLERIRQGSQEDHRRAMLVIMHHGNIERLFQFSLDLKATGRTDVFQIDAAESWRRCLVRSARFRPARCVLTQIGQASMPASSLKSITFPSMTGRAASGPRLPNPNTAEPSETTATLLLLLVKV